MPQDFYFLHEYLNMPVHAAPMRSPEVSTISHTFLLQFYHSLFGIQEFQDDNMHTSFHNSVLVVSASSFSDKPEILLHSRMHPVLSLGPDNEALLSQKNVPTFPYFPFSLQISNDPFLRTLCEMHHNHFPE